ncbi:MAG TPA: hypothetical protein VMI06_13670, partial [Terriglobia bacterium]|nr:hypothetical protein [Terriglobia bacterium]
EMRVAAAQGGIGFLFWNADNIYPQPLEAMGDLYPSGRAAPPGGKTVTEPVSAQVGSSSSHPSSTPSTQTIPR